MKTSMNLLIAAAAAVGLFASSNAVAQTTSTANVGVYSRIVTPITLNEGEEINFGSIYGGLAGTATITPNTSLTAENNSVRSFSSGITGPNQATQGATINNLFDGDGIEQGQIRVAGEAGFTYTMTYGPGVITNGAASMPVSNVTFQLENYLFNGTFSGATGVLPGSISGNVGATAVQLLNVGCTITIAANQHPGIYSGSVPVTATYN